MKHLLQETTNRLSRYTGVDIRTPKAFVETVLPDKKNWDSYVRALSEGLDTPTKDLFFSLANNSRVSLLENSMFSPVPKYETFTIPILRVFLPKLIAKDLVNVMPIDKPDVIKGFVRAYFKRFQDPTKAYQFPSIKEDISSGPTVGISTVAEAEPQKGFDILKEANLDKTKSHIQDNFVITHVIVSDSSASSSEKEIEVNQILSVDSMFSFIVHISDDGSESAVISGNVDRLNGLLNWSATSSKVLRIRFSAVCSLEENSINPEVEYKMEKIRFTTVDRRISASWTINLEQDIKALYDLSLQSEFVNIIGEQIAIDIDREIINALFSANASINPPSHVDTFDKTPRSGYAFGTFEWYRNIQPKLSKLSAQVYNSSLMGPANTIACNPLDASILESLNGWNYAGGSSDGGDMGYSTASVTGGKWKVLVSSLIPEGKMLLKYRNSDLTRASFVYAPYVPALLSPYPLGNNPSLTVISRYSSKIIRPEAIAVLNIIES